MEAKHTTKVNSFDKNTHFALLLINLPRLFRNPPGTDFHEKSVNKRSMKKIAVFLSLTAVILYACKTDFKLTSTWKESMVVYGLLNQSDSVQYIRINRAFLGEGNAYQMAAVHDSSNYNYLLNVRLEKWQNGALVGTLTVDTTTGIAQDGGTFASSPNQIIYRIHTPKSNPLKDDGEYHLTIVNPKTGYTASAKTNLVLGVNSTSGAGMTISAPISGFTSYNFFNLSTPLKLEWYSGQNGRLYEAILRFHYTEKALSGVTEQYVDKDFGQYTTGGISGGEKMNASMSWTDFVSFIGASVPDKPGIISRQFGKCELIIYAAHDEFNTYMEVNKPVSSITGDKPTYTNITNGVGIFSARYTFDDTTHYQRPLSNQTINQAVLDPKICSLHFEDASGNVNCP